MILTSKRRTLQISTCILVYGQPASGKSFSLRNLDPTSTIIIDADKKKSLPWRGWRKQYNKENSNFYSINALSTILKTIKTVGTSEDWKKFNVLVIDGLNNAMTSEVLFYDELHNTNNKFEKYAEVAKKTVQIIDTAQNLRDDLSVIFTAHVETADPYVAGDVDKVFTPGKMLKDKIKLESKFSYVFYAKSEEGNFFFETVPNNSTARTPYGFSESIIPNDLAEILNMIKVYEAGESVND